MGWKYSALIGWKIIYGIQGKFCKKTFKVPRSATISEGGREPGRNT
jgi:hypothetical protein